MSSGILTRIRLEPFYQQFLRGYYQISEPVFKFPRADADELCLAYKFNNLLMPSPPNYKTPDFGEEMFIIETPFQPDKDPFYYNYISTTRNEVLARAIEKAYRFYFHERMKDFRNGGFSYKECVNLFLDECNIDSKYSDRAIKDYQRWKILVSVRKNQQKAQSQNRIIC